MTDLTTLTTGALVDAAAAIIIARDKLVADAAKLNEEFTLYENEITRRLQNDDAISIASASHKFVACPKTFYSVDKDHWDDFWNWVYDNRAGYLMNKTVNRKSIAEAVDNGMEIPGVKEFTTTKISLTKSK
jgi:hypothetical protein